MGELPSQQPPDWWKSSAPCFASRRAMSVSAAAVALTRAIGIMAVPRRTRKCAARQKAVRRSARSEEPERLRRIAHQQVLCLLIVVKHHLVCLAPDARLLVAAERCVRRIGVVAVGPYAAGLDLTAHAV